MYVQAVVDSLNERFLDSPIFNTSILFTPKYDPSDEEVPITISEQWLKRLIIKFGLMAVESDASRVELLEFVETLRHECENKSLCTRYVNFVRVSMSGIPIGHISWNFGQK